MGSEMKFSLLIILAFCISSLNGTDDFGIDSNSISLSFLENLSELPLEKLLQVKKSLNELRQTNFSAIKNGNEMDEGNHESRIISDYNVAPEPMDIRWQKNVMALTEEKQITKKNGEWMDPWDTKPTKVQTFFQISITALAFLSFAGYLLCMIVQAIKSKGTMYLYPNSMSLTNTANTMNSLVNTGAVPLIRKRRPLGRRRRNIIQSAANLNETYYLDGEEPLASPDPAEMYNVMIQCAEDYNKLFFISGNR